MTFSWGGYLLGVATSLAIFAALFVGIVLGAKKSTEINAQPKKGIHVS